MKHVGFVQPNYQIGPKELRAFYLPYSAGIILSAAMSNDQVRSQWGLGEIIWRRESTDAAAEKLKNHDLVGFSTYVWNYRYNCEVADKLKKLNPDIQIVFGGPQMPIKDPKIFNNHPYIDIVVQVEGEYAFTEILKKFPGDYNDVPGLLINQAQSVVATAPPQRIENLDHIPSPYLTGVFDRLIQDNPDVTWNATLETNRGCPFACTFCDWGSLTYNKIKNFGLERVYDELDWIGEHCGFVTITDANFGIFVERDNLIVDKLIEVQLKWGRLKSFGMTWTKNQKNEVVAIVKNSLTKVQTLDKASPSVYKA